MVEKAVAKNAKKVPEKAGDKETKKTAEVKNAVKTVEKEVVQKKVETKPENVQENPVNDVKNESDGFFRSGIAGLDSLFTEGLPRGSSILVSGGAGSGKTLLTLQMLYNSAKSGKKCFYMSFEESEERLKSHMEKFGWDVKSVEKNLLIKRFNLFDITRTIDALMAKQSGELLIDVEPVIMPKDFMPDLIVVDSLAAIASAFYGKGETYRLYINQLFRFFEDQDVTTFLISETNQDPRKYSPTGVEEFLADGVIVLYNIRNGNVREHGLEVLKMRGTNHEKKVVAMQIISGTGVEIFPEQEVFSVE